MIAPDDDVLAPIRRAILDLRRLMPSVRSATVTGVNPLRVQFDGETAPVSASPTSLVPVGPGDRVRVLHYGNTDLILGVVGTSTATAHLKASGAHNISNGIYDWIGPMGVADNTNYGKFAYAQSQGTVYGQGLRALTDGVFRVDCSVRMQDNARGVLRALVDGTVEKVEWGPGGTTNWRSVSITHTARLAAGQRLGVQFHQDSGASVPRESGASTTLTLTFLGA